MKREFHGRNTACLLLILSSVFSFLLLPLLFREKSLRPQALFLSLVCFLSALAAIIVFLSIGRGLSLSATSCGALALALSLSLLPEPYRGKH